MTPPQPNPPHKQPWHSSELLEHLRELRAHLLSKIIGQDKVIEQLVPAIQAAALGLNTPGRPLGTYLFLGPTGVGKTEIVRVLAHYLDIPLVRLDMSEFQLQDALNRLIGESKSDPGLLASRMTEAVTDSHGHGILLLDEIEKAHPKILDLLLQMLDAARITLANGDTLDFSHWHIFMTTNLASHALTEISNLPTSARDRFIKAEAERTLRPEIVGRIAHFLTFDPLDQDSLLTITKLMTDGEIARYQEQGIALTVTPDVYPFLLSQGADRHLGARPLRHTIENHLRSAVVSTILSEGRNRGVVSVVGREIKIVNAAQLQN